MTSDLLTDILSKSGNCEREGTKFTIPSATEATVFAAVGSEPLIVERIASIHLEPNVVVVETSRRERYFFAYEDVRALRFHQT